MSCVEPDKVEEPSANDPQPERNNESLDRQFGVHVKEDHADDNDTQEQEKQRQQELDDDDENGDECEEEDSEHIVDAFAGLNENIMDQLRFVMIGDTIHNATWSLAKRALNRKSEQADIADEKDEEEEEDDDDDEEEEKRKILKDGQEGDDQNWSSQFDEQSQSFSVGSLGPDFDEGFAPLRAKNIILETNFAPVAFPEATVYEYYHYSANETKKGRPKQLAYADEGEIEQEEEQEEENENEGEYEDEQDENEEENENGRDGDEVKHKDNDDVDADEDYDIWIDPRRKRRVQSLMKHYKLTVENVKEYIADPETMSIEILNAIAEALPLPEEEEELLQFRGNIKKLDPVIRFMGLLCEPMPSLREQLTAYITASSFNAIAKEIISEIAVYQLMCREILSSSSLSTSLRMVLWMGNAMQLFGGDEPADSVRLDVLPNLPRTPHPKNPHFTLMDTLVHAIQKKYPGLLPIENLRSLERLDEMRTVDELFMETEDIISCVSEATKVAQAFYETGRADEVFYKKLVSLLARDSYTVLECKKLENLARSNSIARDSNGLILLGDQDPYDLDETEENPEDDADGMDPYEEGFDEGELEEYERKGGTTSYVGSDQAENGENIVEADFDDDNMFGRSVLRNHLVSSHGSLRLKLANMMMYFGQDNVVSRTEQYRVLVILRDFVRNIEMSMEKLRNEPFSV